MTPLPQVEQECGNCRFWEQYSPPKGECRRYPPMIVVGQVYCDGKESLENGIWPHTGQGAWCGEWQQKEGGE